MSTITLIDTSVLCELLQVPGKCDPDLGPILLEEMDDRVNAGELLVIPVTAVVETGNHIAQCAGDRHALAMALVGMLRRAAKEDTPWRVLNTAFDGAFLLSLCDGDSTGEDLAQLAAEGVGAGDVAILVERDVLKKRSSARVQVWTLDGGLGTKALVSP